METYEVAQSSLGLRCDLIVVEDMTNALLMIKNQLSELARVLFLGAN